jgi:hypothetical protein
MHVASACSKGLLPSDRAVANPTREHHSRTSSGSWCSEPDRPPNMMGANSLHACCPIDSPMVRSRERGGKVPSQPPGQSRKGSEVRNVIFNNGPDLAPKQAVSSIRILAPFPDRFLGDR